MRNQTKVLLVDINEMTILLSPDTKETEGVGHDELSFVCYTAEGGSSDRVLKSITARHAVVYGWMPVNWTR